MKRVSDETGLKSEHVLSYGDLVKVARRDNNSLRPYLYVNPMQGKHIPAEIGDILRMCHALSSIANALYSGERLYVIGFAETACGIASVISRFLNNVIFYQNTTREKCEEAGCIHFVEAHSHATDQMIRTDGVGDCLSLVDRIIFIDDEVTTGNTICNLIDSLAFLLGGRRMAYSVVSVLNSMTNERLAEMKAKGIECVYLLRMPFEYGKDKAVGEFQKYADCGMRGFCANHALSYDEIVFDTHLDARFCVCWSNYDKECRRFAKKIAKEALRNHHYESLLVLGTEEFMYQAICIGEIVKYCGMAESVKMHATTRSPIIASEKEDYPLKNRYCFRSPYDSSRKTFAYNLGKYDKVIVVTDAHPGGDGVADIVSALNEVGNDDVTMAWWCYKG